MTDAATLNALAKLFANEAKKAPLTEAGRFTVEGSFTVDVKATVSKFADETYVPTASIPLKPVLALLLHRMGCTRDKAMDIIVEVMTAAINLDADGSDMLTESIKDINTAMARVEQMAAALPPKVRAGKTTIAGKVEIHEAVTA